MGQGCSGEGKGELTPGHVGYKLRVRGVTPRRGGTTATKLERHTLTEVNSEKSEERFAVGLTMK